MTKRLPVSTQENTWFDSQQVDAEDLQAEQEHNDQQRSAFINNHFGSGILPAVLSQPVLLDTDAVVGLLDGKPILTTQDPSDTNEGVQLEIELLTSAIYGDSEAFGRRQVKVCIIGLNFNNELQFDTFYFSKHQTYITAKHYISVLSVLFNDMRGVTGKSFNLGGRIVIREAQPFAISSDTLMVAQDEEPNLFFRDFYTDPAYVSLTSLLAAAVSGFSVDSLDIAVGPKQYRKLLRSDVVTQLGQKFQATTNNIQKVSLMMSVEKNLTGTADTDLSWTGDLVVSIYSLQSTVSSSSQITPELAIDFDPSNLPLAQASVNLATLQTNGILLDGYAQPVDFVFSNTPIAAGGLTPGSFYAFTVKRSGSADKCNILMPVGGARVENSRVTIFNGTSWVDIQEENLWFQIWTDAAKVSDGQAYDAGEGVFLPKTSVDPLTGATIDHALRHQYFTTTSRFYGVVKAAVEESVVVQDQRTGNNIFSRKQFAPELDLVSDSALATLKLTSEPLIIGTVQDKNIKSYDATTLTSKFTHFGIYKNEVIIKVIDSNLDPNNNVALITAIQNGSLINATFTPNTSSPSDTYRVATAEVLTMSYGDIDGDGIVDDDDAIAATALIGKTLVSSPSSADYITSTNDFTDEVTVNFELYNISDLVTPINTGTCTLTANTTDGSYSAVSNIVFASPYGVGGFAALGAGNLKFKIPSGTNPTVGAENYGTHSISAITSNAVCTINKFLMTGDAIMSILRADIDNDFTVDSSDATDISNYSLHVALSGSALNVARTFRVIRLRLEKSVDRLDDYPSNVTDRSSYLHAIQDLPVNDSTLLSHNYVSSNVTFTISKSLTWQSNLVITARRTRLVPASFTYDTEPTTYSCSTTTTGIVSSSYPTTSSVDPGRNDFYVPNNLVIGNKIVNPDGTDYRNDIEVGTVVLEMPSSFIDEKSFNVFTSFVADTTGTGKTTLGYPCMRFADCSVVDTGALVNNQVRFSVSIQSFYSDIDGYSVENYEGIIVDPKIGVSVDYTTGLLTLNFSHLLQDPNLLTLNTKIQITVYLKKAGFNNSHLFVDSSKMSNILGL